jgi:ATP-dependent RNA helicase SUPV3L1/SUV3
VPAAAVAAQVATLTPKDRAALAQAGVRFGREAVYLEPLLRPEAMRLRALLWAVRHGRPVPALPASRRHGRAWAVDPALPRSFYSALGLFVLGRWALRPDRLERLAAAAQRVARNAPFTADKTLAAAAGVALPALPPMLEALGYRAVSDGTETRYLPPSRRRRRAVVGRVARPPHDGHPFAKLRELKLA